MLKSEDLRSDPAAVLERVRAFLGIAAFGPTASRDVYPGQYLTGPETEARRRLAERFEHDVRDLERMFGLDCSGWLRESRG